MGKDNKGGRPPKMKTKLLLRSIMKELCIGDVNWIKKKFIEMTGFPANYHTIKKYLDQLVNEDYLRVQVVQDNIGKIEKGESKTRRRIYLYQIN